MPAIKKDMQTPLLQDESNQIIVKLDFLIAIGTSMFPSIAVQAFIAFVWDALFYFAQ